LFRPALKVCCPSKVIKRESIRFFNGTLVMPEQVKIDADIEVGVAD